MLVVSGTRKIIMKPATWEYRKTGVLPAATNKDKPLLRREMRSLRPPSLLAREFAVWQGFWARQAIQGAIQALIEGREIGRSSAISERF
jgi:hypothetical protein